jgi:hypothetical protein
MQCTKPHEFKYSKAKVDEFPCAWTNAETVSSDRTLRGPWRLNKFYIQKQLWQKYSIIKSQRLLRIK